MEREVGLQSRHIVAMLVVGRAFHRPPFTVPVPSTHKKSNPNHVTSDKQMDGWHAGCTLAAGTREGTWLGGGSVGGSIGGDGGGEESYFFLSIAIQKPLAKER
jgi:hypothetical protein